MNLEKMFTTATDCVQNSLFHVLESDSFCLVPGQKINAETNDKISIRFLCVIGTAKGHYPFAVPNQSAHGKYNLISV